MRWGGGGVAKRRPCDFLWRGIGVALGEGASSVLGGVLYWFFRGCCVYGNFWCCGVGHLVGWCVCSKFCVSEVAEQGSVCWGGGMFLGFVA